MTTKRDSKLEQDASKPDKPPKLRKETVRDLTPEQKGEGVRGGAPIDTQLLPGDRRR